MRKSEFRVETEGDFFKRGRTIGRLADRGERIPERRVVAFEDAGSLLSVLSEKRVHLLKEVKAAPASISSLAKRLNRDRSAVTRDVQLLERFGVLQVKSKPLHGHGRQKWVAPVANEIRLTAVL